MATVLIIDDDPGIQDTLSLMVERMGHRPLTAARLAQGIATARDNEVDVVFLDVRLPDGSGLDALQDIERVPSSPEVIILTGFGDPQGAELAIKSGAWDYLEKTASAKEINLALDRALQYRQEKQLAQRGAKISALKREGIIGDSQKLRACLELVAQAALGEADVLITGETGTGKEFIANYIHKISQRRDGLLVKVNCPALASSLFESELFGHSKGAFTGASAQRVGRFEMADGGTIFLDEIGDLPIPLQAKILHVLQDQAFERVGESRTIRANFRVIAATNQDLERAIREHTFRSDLYYRLSTIALHLPPLRERIEDIPPLLAILNENQARAMHRPAPAYPDEVVGELCRHPWPGNIRELKNLVSRMIILRPGQTVSVQDVRSHFGEYGLEHGDTRFQTLEEAERAHITKALAKAKGMVAGARGAAALLGVPRSTLQYRMRKYGLKAGVFRGQEQG